MSLKSNFSLCRACYASQITSNLTCLFSGTGENAKKFSIISGVNIFKDKDKHEALICDGCLEDLNEAILLREKMRNTEMFYFQKQRTLDLNSDAPTVQPPKQTFDDVKKNSKKRKCQEKQPTEDSSVEIVYFKNEASNDNESHNDVEIAIDKVNRQQKEKSSTKKPYQKWKNQCDECGKAFGDRYKLKRHVEGVHQKIKNFECTICPSKFYRKFHLERHNRSHILKSELPELPDIPFREEMDDE